MQRSVSHVGGAAAPSVLATPQRVPLPLQRSAAPALRTSDPASGGSCSCDPAPRTAVLAAAGKAKGAAGSKGKGFGAANAASASKLGVTQTCACGSKSVYRECCEPYHAGAAVPPDVEAALRARFCAFVKGRVPYLVSTFHPNYHSFKYEGSAPGGATAQLRRDVEAATKRFTYSNLKVLAAEAGSHPDEAFITFRYNSVNKVNPDRGIDGSIIISTTVERSRFLRAPTPDASSAAGAGPGAWLFADYELIDYPSWMEEAKQAERRAREGQQGQPQQVAAETASAAGAAR
ncbi:hypothetical protein GPECTOR_5g408 [Gonium pectorale]|uniref:YchJ-like middle NTF2-like domain-containing protein n=1 Tax=Gonium pectorale TaxID=33097 RepID=A0A150GWY6_GONPE|nr:hypothetical protein GPECTOR_5g408 [Gonium pectorale]|eukprot:KXZ54324.1 hypothetical protein GPECTOR_5g408 [Gonium pectorale]